MNSAMTYKTTTTDSASTMALAAPLAKLLTGGEVIELASDLGGGKTVFARGLIQALGSTDEITSPTFTLSRIYHLPDGREVHHYDLYRLNEAGVVGDELSEDVGADGVITIIEWAGIAEDVLPADRLRVDITVTGENDRELVFSGDGAKAQVIIKELST